jgi:hypothetical protein
MRRCPQGHDVPDASFQFCPTCGEEIHEVESTQAFGPPLRLTDDAAPVIGPSGPEQLPGQERPHEQERTRSVANEDNPKLAAEVAALRRASEEREARSAKTRKWIIVGLLLLVLALLGLWETGRMDTTLAGIGLNKNDCIKNAFGATFCGDAAKRYQTQVSAALGTDSTSSDQDASTAASDVRAAIPAAEAYYADNGSYAGMTIALLRGQYDNSIAPEVRLGRLSAGTTYCLEATVGAATYSTTRGDAPVADGNVVAGPC